jgi:hypothetical protein
MNDKTCDVHGCENEARWWWDNPHNSVSGMKCHKHAKSLAFESKYPIHEMKNDGVIKPLENAPGWVGSTLADDSQTER